VTVDDFEAHRDHLRAVAHRMLGSRSEADDAVQETWLRWSRAEHGGAPIENVRGWLTTVIARICLDMLRTRTSRREEPIEAHEPAAASNEELMLADSIGVAMLVVLDTLAPPERLAFVLHDLFAVPFEDIAPIVGRTPTAARQLASRARRRVQGAAADTELDRARSRAVVDAFLTAARGGDFDALLAVLDPDVVVRADATAQKIGAAREQRGAAMVARTWKGRAAGATQAWIDGAPGAAWIVDGKPKVVLDFTIRGGRVVAIDLIGDPETQAQLDLAIG
jgi:RNA polymerase sigma-70 factor (ECF subfamily)